MYQNSVEFARQLDARDVLRDFRQRYHIPRLNGKDVIYFTGNSLGLQPKNVKAYVEQELDDWARLGVEGHFEAGNPWFSYHEIFPRLLSPIVGGLPEEIVVMNGLTVNLHLLLTSFYRPTPQRFRILCEAKAFPSDQYALESQVRLHGLLPEDAIIEVTPRHGEHTLRTADILEAIRNQGSTLALVLIGGVNYYTGQVMDMEAITAAAHSVGAYAGFDLAHAVGNIDLKLHQWNVDFACWCSYKYLNSGPGGVAGAFIHQQHITNTSLPRLAGWWGYEKDSRFQMRAGFKPIPTAEGWQLSNAPVLTMAAHKAALDLFEEAGMDRLIQKGKALAGFLHFLLSELNNGSNGKQVEIITPDDAAQHGCQVSILMLQNGRAVFEELIRRGVVADWREPNVIRVAPVPMYNSFEDVYQFSLIIREMLSK